MSTFTPNVKPRMVFKKGAFGGTYFRTIESDVVGKKIFAKHFFSKFQLGHKYLRPLADKGFPGGDFRWGHSR